MPIAEDKIREALKQVIDPELFVNIVDLGLIYEVKIDEQPDGKSNVGDRDDDDQPGLPGRSAAAEPVEGLRAAARRRRRGRREARDGTALDARSHDRRRAGPVGDLLTRVRLRSRTADRSDGLIRIRDLSLIHALLPLRMGHAAADWSNEPGALPGVAGPRRRDDDRRAGGRSGPHRRLRA